MKHIRNILLLITIIFAFVMQAEVYQNMLWNFNGAYYLSSRYTTTNDDMDSFLANAEDTAEKHGVHIFSTFNQRVSNYQTRLYIYGDDTVVRDSLKSTMDIEEKTYTALIGGITVIEFEDFREAKNTGNGQEIMVSYIGDDDDIIATYQDLAKEYSISQPEFWQSTETDMMFIVWGLVAILMIVLNMIEVIRRQKEVVVRASLGENAAVIALKAVVADMISYAALFVLAKLLVSQFISGAYEDHLILAVYCAGAVLSVIPYAAFVRFDVKKAFANASDKKGMFYLLNGLKVFATAMTIFTITTNLSSIQGNLLTNTTLLENHYNDYYFGVMQIEPPFEENEEESKESEFWNDLYENEYNTINPVVCIGSRISDTDNYIFVNHNARDMLQGFSDMLTEDDEKEDIVVFVPKGKNAESYKDIAKEEIDSLTQNAEELRVVYKEYSGREQFYYLNSNREEAIDGLSRATNPIVIYQANEAVALNGSYIETGTYKTYFAMRLAAACTNRKPLPGMETLEPFNIIYQTAEDGLGDTVKPRLMEAEADLERVLVIDDRDTPLTLADERIARAIRENNARLVIIDPVQAFLGADVDMNRANEVRPIFRSLGDIAQATGCAIVLIGHLNKAVGTQSTYRGLGSIDITAAVRSLLFIGKLKDSPTTRVLIHEKSSLAPPGQSLAFSLGDEKGFEWIGAYDITADELLAGADNTKTESKTAQAQMLILELLADGKRMPSAELEKAVNERGISSRTMRTAKSRIGDRLVTEKDGTAWVCYLRD